jgi:hypothetical protein
MRHGSHHSSKTPSCIFWLLRRIEIQWMQDFSRYMAGHYFGRSNIT